MSAAAFFLLQASLRGSVLILAVLALRVLLRRLPKRGICLLWMAVWLRLALPFALRSRFSLLPSWLLLSQSGYEPADMQGLLINQTAASAFTLPAFSPHLDWLLLVWASGLAILLLAALIRYGLLKRRVREAIPLRDRLWLCDWVESPFVLGLFRPRIYLPSGVEERDILWIEAHEEAHLRRGDPWLKLTAFLLTAIYWFQPLVWVAFFLYQRDLELACDEQASRNYNLEARNEYINALVRASIPERFVWCAPLGFGSAPLRKRIQAIRQPPKCSRWLLSLAALFSVIVLVACTVEPIRAAQTMTEPEHPIAEIRSEAPVSDQQEIKARDLTGDARWVAQPDNDQSARKWFLVADPSGDANVLLFPDGSSVVLYGEPVIICCDEKTGQTFAIDPVSREGDAP